MFRGALISLLVLGMRRKPYVFIGGVVGVVGWVVLCSIATLPGGEISRPAVIGAFFLTSFSSAIADVVIDATVCSSSIM